MSRTQILVTTFFSRVRKPKLLIAANAAKGLKLWMENEEIDQDVCVRWFQLGRTAEYYRGRPGDLDASLLRVVPDAPRTSAAFPPSWDWAVVATDGALSKQTSGASRRPRVCTQPYSRLAETAVRTHNILRRNAQRADA